MHTDEDDEETDTIVGGTPIKREKIAAKTKDAVTTSAKSSASGPIILNLSLDLKQKRKRASRGGVRRLKSVPRSEKGKVKLEESDDEPDLPFGLPEDKDLGWQEVMLHGLLLAGVPERLLSTEMKPLEPMNRESVFEAGEIFSKAMAERSVDPLLNETDTERIEREDALAIEAIDDDELDYMFRTNEEMEVVRLLRAHEENIIGGV
jgi:hypothetical protein